MPINVNLLKRQLQAEQESSSSAEEQIKSLNEQINKDIESGSSETVNNMLKDIVAASEPVSDVSEDEDSADEVPSDEDVDKDEESREEDDDVSDGEQSESSHDESFLDGYGSSDREEYDVRTYDPDSDSDVEDVDPDDLEDAVPESLPDKEYDEYPPEEESDSEDVSYEDSSYAEYDERVPDTDDYEPVIDEKEELPVKETKPVAKVAKKSPVSKTAKKSNDFRTSELREFPTELANHIKNQFGGKATAMGDAVAAYVYLKEGCPEDIPVSDKILELVGAYQGDTISNSDLQHEFLNINKNLQENIQLLKRLLKGDITKHLVAIEIAILTGLLEDNEGIPDDIEFDSSELGSLLAKLDDATVRRIKHDAFAAGRPHR